MPTLKSPEEKRRVGRPRKRESSPDVDPRENILATAARLFAEKGIGEVSMFEIAQESGLVQSSLYYWFRRKEWIVAELLQQTNRQPLGYAKQLRQQGELPDVQLYRLVRFDVRNVCMSPLEITEVHQLSSRDVPAFATYWRERQELTATFEALIDCGVQSGVFRQVIPRLSAITILAQNESVQNWHKGYQRGGSKSAYGDAAEERYSCEEIAEFVAGQTLACLLACPTRVEHIRQQARHERAHSRTSGAPR